MVSPKAGFLEVKIVHRRGTEEHREGESKTARLS